jgi:hypothetical protein
VKGKLRVDTSPNRKLSQQFGAICGNILTFSQKEKSAMVTIRSENQRKYKNTQG